MSSSFVRENGVMTSLWRIIFPPQKFEFCHYVGVMIVKVMLVVAPPIALFP
jgi:hypothetical protein